jgi:hypothetical protein
MPHHLTDKNPYLWLVNHFAEKMIQLVYQHFLGMLLKQTFSRKLSYNSRDFSIQ